jgi:hypothetical protein
MVGGEFALPNFSNVKDDLAMGSRKLTADDLARITKLAKSWGKIVVRQAFGDGGPGLEADLTQMEDVAVAAAAGLTAGALEEATAQQGRLLGAEQPCPDCGRRCAVGAEERPVLVRGGVFEHQEPKCYCPACRRAFFPTASAAEARRQRL